MRGKNLAFANLIANVLQLDSLPEPVRWGDVKRAITPAVVRRLYKGVVDLWPDKPDLLRVLATERGRFSGLYVGTYEAEAIQRGIVRHCLYSDSILVIDPFPHPHLLREEFNPIARPEIYRSTTAQAVGIWWTLFPWIDAGVVRMVRTPGDFDPDLFLRCGHLADERTRRHPELKQILDQMSEEAKRGTLAEAMRLAEPIEFLLEEYKKFRPGASPAELDVVAADLRRRRDNHPFLIVPPEVEAGKGAREMWVTTTGASYDMARITADISGSHLITDLAYRWKEMELVVQKEGGGVQPWEPFAKAIQNLPWRRLENVDLGRALRLRKEGRLEDMRGFLNKTWKGVAETQPWSESIAVDLAHELQVHYRDAESEWKKVERDLIALAKGEAAVALGVAAPAIASGNGAWLGAAAVVAGLADLYKAKKDREDVRRRLPAAFFVGDK